MKRVLPHILASAVILGIFATPSIAGAQFDLIVCGEGDMNSNSYNPCDFDDFIILIKNLISALLKVSTLVATAVFVWMGVLLLTSGGNPSAKDKAKKMGMSVLKGYLWILAAWILVYTITSAVLNDEYTDILGN